MKDDKGHGHRHGRATRRFDTHARRRVEGSDGLRSGRPWRFIDRGLTDVFEPHYRVTARMAALPGKHMRRVEEPIRATHGKAL